MSCVSGSRRIFPCSQFPGLELKVISRQLIQDLKRAKKLGLGFIGGIKEMPIKFDPERVG